VGSTVTFSRTVQGQGGTLVAKAIEPQERHMVAGILNGFSHAVNYIGGSEKGRCTPL